MCDESGSLDLARSRAQIVPAMPEPLPYSPLPWKIRLIMLAVAVVLASSVVATYGAGVRFAKVMETVEHQQAVNDAVAVAAAKRAAAGETDSGVVTVGILPTKPAGSSRH